MLNRRSCWQPERLVCAVRRSGDRGLKRLLRGVSGVQIAPHFPSNTPSHTHTHRVSSLYHKSLTTERSSNRRRLSSTFHLCVLLCCCRAGRIYSSVRQDRKRGGGGRCQAYCITLTLCYLQPPQVPGVQSVTPAALQAAATMADAEPRWSFYGPASF